MYNFVFFLLPLFAAFPAVEVNWASKPQEQLEVLVSGEDDLSQECVKGGLEARYRFELQVCKRRSFWMDGCADRRVEVRSMRFDPISERYRIAIDRFDDGKDPQNLTVESIEEAIPYINKIEDIDLEFLARGDRSMITSKRGYLSVRVVTDCKGDYNESLADISYFLSLGLLRVNGYNSGWTDFALRH